MAHVLTIILPLDIGAILTSPLIFIVSIILLSQTYYPQTKLIAFALPAFIMSALVTFVGYNLGQTVVKAPQADSVQGTTNIIIAVVFFVLAFCSWVIKEKKFKVDKNAKGKKIFRWFLLGSLMNLTNWNSLVLIMAAGKEVGTLKNISEAIKWTLLFLNIFLYTLTVTFPLFLTMLFPSIATSVLSAISTFLKKYSRIIVTIMFLLFGLIFLQKGIATVFH